MKFYLAKDQTVTFPEVPYTANGYNKVSTTSHIAASLTAKDGYSEAEKQIFSKLKWEETCFDGALAVTVTAVKDNKYSLVYGIRAPSKFRISIGQDKRTHQVVRSNSILAKICADYPTAKIRVRLQNFGIYEQDHCTAQYVNLVSNEISIENGRCKSSRIIIPPLTSTDVDWSYDLYIGCTYGSLTITVKIPNDQIEPTVAIVPIKDEFYINKKILDEGLAHDLVITSGNGTKINCHKSFLSAHSSVLQAMFLSGMNESKTSTVEMTDMSEEGVKAFLAYLYYWDTNEANRSTKIAFELFCAGHKYDVPSLEWKMMNVLLQKRNEEYTVADGLKLFCFVRHIESAENLKRKAAQVLKTKFEEMENSEEYDYLFRQHPEAAKELCRYFTIV